MVWARFGFAGPGDELPIDQWMDDRDDYMGQRKSFDAAGQDAWSASTRSGENLDAPGQVMSRLSGRVLLTRTAWRKRMRADRLLVPTALIPHLQGQRMFRSQGLRQMMHPGATDIFGRTIGPKNIAEFVADFPYDGVEVGDTFVQSPGHGVTNAIAQQIFRDMGLHVSKLRDQEELADTGIRW